MSCDTQTRPAPLVPPLLGALVHLLPRGKSNNNSHPDDTTTTTTTTTTNTANTTNTTTTSHHPPEIVPEPVQHPVSPTQAPLATVPVPLPQAQHSQHSHQHQQHQQQKQQQQQQHHHHQQQHQHQNHQQPPSDTTVEPTTTFEQVKYIAQLDCDGWAIRRGLLPWERTAFFLALDGFILTVFKDKTGTHGRFSINVRVHRVTVDVPLAELSLPVRDKDNQLKLHLPSIQDAARWAAAIDAAVRSDIAEHYHLGKSIGSGAYGNVVEGYDVRTNQKRAIKIIQRGSNTKSREHLSREIQVMMRNVSHPGIVRTYQIFDLRRTIYIVMEFVPGGDLFDYIAEQESLTEAQAVQVIRSILEAVDHLHRHHIVHRDLKPENILCVSRTWPLHIKITDFGFSSFIDPELGDDKSMKTPVGTAYFMAPEIIQNHGHGAPVDVFACGVILYTMLTGRLPFPGHNTAEYFKSVVNGNARFPDVLWRGISDDAKRLVRGMINPDPNKRVTAFAALQHDWLWKKSTASENCIRRDRSNLHSRKRRLHKARAAVYAIEMALRIKALHESHYGLDKIPEVMDAVGEGTKKIAKGVGEGVKKTADGIETGVKKTVDGLETGVKKAKEGIETGVKKTVDGLETGVKKTKEGIETGVKKTKEGIETGVKKTKEGLETGVKKTKEGLETGVKKTKEGIETGVKKTKEGIETGVKKTVEGLETGAKKTGEGVKKAADTIGDGIKVTAKGIETGVKMTVDGLGTGVKKTSEGVKKAADGLEESMKKTADGLGHGVKKTVQGIETGVKKTVDGIEIGVKKTSHSIKKTGHGIRKGAEKFPIPMSPRRSSLNSSGDGVTRRAAKRARKQKSAGSPRSGAAFNKDHRFDPHSPIDLGADGVGFENGCRQDSSIPDGSQERPEMRASTVTVASLSLDSCESEESFVSARESPEPIQAEVLKESKSQHKDVNHAELSTNSDVEFECAGHGVNLASKFPKVGLHLDISSLSSQQPPRPEVLRRTLNMLMESPSDVP